MSAPRSVHPGPHRKRPGSALEAASHLPPPAKPTPNPSAGFSSSWPEQFQGGLSFLVTEKLPAIICVLQTKPPDPHWSAMNKASLKTRLAGRLSFLFLIPGLLCGLRTVIAEESGSPGPNIHLRGNFLNSHFSFSARKKGHVAFIGGSITAMNGYRPMLCSFLQKRFPETKFTFTNAGISSTCSTSGAFRLQRDVLSRGPVDLFFIEYAVNDDQDAAHARRECIRGMEGILRQVRAHNPMADIVITHFVNPGMLKTVGKGKEPVSSGAHEDVAKHYGVSTIHLIREVDRLIAAGELTWRKFGGTHPGGYVDGIKATLTHELSGADIIRSLQNTSVAGGQAEASGKAQPGYSFGHEYGWFGNVQNGFERIRDALTAVDMVGVRHVPGMKIAAA